ncbi:MAG: hypothetical protein JO283_13290 [Bradyrhizobium sp.]|nr:hypothetical protein [Bradyrhizobium sp.]
MIPTLRCDFAESILRFSGVGRVGRLRKILPWIHLQVRAQPSHLRKSAMRKVA